MDAVTAFGHRKEALRAQLENAGSVQQALSAAAMALEQTACELAQDEQDEHARQRQQAVMALARRAPDILQAAQAKGELVLASEAPTQKGRNVPRILQAAGVIALAALAVYEWLSGRSGFALVQVVGLLLVVAGGARAQSEPGEQAEARAAMYVDAPAMVRQLEQLCQAADICVSDLSLLETPGAPGRLSGTADDAMLDLLVAMMEAKQAGRSEAALRSLSMAEEYLHLLGIEIVLYAPEEADKFDLLPTMGPARTVRPALYREGQLVRRGVAACPARQAMEGGATA